MGVVQLALPIALYVKAARYVSAMTMTLISLLDVVFNPLWASSEPADALPLGAAGLPPEFG